MKTLPPIVDDDGNINLHGRQGAVITVKFTNDDGTARNMSGRTLTFECGTSLNITLTNGSTTDERILTLANSDVKSIFALKNRDFVVLDYTAAVPTPLWAGTVYVQGWVE